MIAFADQFQPPQSDTLKKVLDALDTHVATKPLTMADFTEALTAMLDWPVCPCGFSIEPGTKCPCCGGTGK